MKKNYYFTLGSFLFAWFLLIDISLLAVSILFSIYFNLIFMIIFWLLWLVVSLFLILTTEILYINNKVIETKCILRGKKSLEWSEIKEIEVIKVSFIKFIYITDFKMPTSEKLFLSVKEKGLIRTVYNKKLYEAIQQRVEQTNKE